MKHTNRQTTTATATDLHRAIDRRHAVTITYLDEHGDQTIRTIEPHSIETTTTGGRRVRAMCRLRGDERTFDLTRIVSYTLHRIAFILDRPTPKTPMPPAPTRSAAALIAYELNRDVITAAFRARHIHRTSTLAA
ncbi:WYL domain-containing protein [Streptomyces sp. DH12]|uniref:WYL domain-containing protein n=1 Tax=Streptomyces sp. DH12 TaxID=2857010 RepID=UPI001E3EFA12|nr:WYL domain-containing protein [Streptomyces sp. DH12]